MHVRVNEARQDRRSVHVDNPGADWHFDFSTRSDPLDQIFADNDRGKGLRVSSRSVNERSVDDGDDAFAGL